MLCRYERTIFKSDKGFCIFAYSTSDESVCPIRFNGLPVSDERCGQFG